MIALELVRKRKIRRIAALVALIGSLGVGSLGTIAFLGRFVGTFTVSVDNGEVLLSLDEKKAFENPQSYLRINSLPVYTPVTYNELLREYPADQLDNEETSYLLGRYVDQKGKESIQFFKYTYYVKNSGGIAARYNISFNILESTPDNQESEPRYLDDILRVMIFDHDSEDEQHDFHVYAKKTSKENYLKDGTLDTQGREFIYDPPRKTDPNDPSKELDPKLWRVESDKYQFAETFKSGNEIASYGVQDFQPAQIRRYTFVAWLEGSDPDCYGSVPTEASIRLGVEINAYEN